MWAYRLMRWFLRQVVRTFYRQVVAVGLENIPPEGSGPVLFAGNHPNSLIDPLLIVATSGRIVCFAAKDTLFRSRLLRVFLRALGAVPIRRRMDHGEGSHIDNSEAFDALFGVLAGGRCIGIFPEGISHDQAQLARLKTGAARIAYGVMAQRPDLPLRVVPCGLTYIHRRHFRSRVLVQYGPPIVIGAEELGRYAADERKAVRDLTADIDAGLRALTINASDWATLRVLDAVRRMYQPPKIPLRDRVELARRFSLVYEQVKDEPDVVRLFERVRDYNRRLRDVGLTDAQLRRPLRPAAVAGKIAWQLWWVLVLLPLAAPGVVVHAPIGMLMVWAGQRWAPRKDVVGTSKLVVGLLLVAIAYAGLCAAAAIAYGPHALALALVLLPLSAYATIRVLERAASVRRLLMRVLRTLVLGREVAALRALRAELEGEIVTAVERFRPRDMQPLYPRPRSGEAAELP